MSDEQTQVEEKRVTNPRGRVGFQFTSEQLIEAIEGSKGLNSVIARRLGCSTIAVKNHIPKHPEAMEALASEVEKNIDEAERTVNNAIIEGDVATARWYLQTMGKRRGFTEKTEVEHSGPDGGPIEVSINLIKPGE